MKKPKPTTAEERKRIRTYGIRGTTKAHILRPGFTTTLLLPEDTQALTAHLMDDQLLLYTLEPLSYSVSSHRHFRVCRTDEIIAPGWWHMNQWIASIPVPGIVRIWHVYELLEMER